MSAREWFEQQYATVGDKAQRRYPNEEMVRFFGRRGLSASAKVLEMGCGGGANLSMIASEYQAFGLDASFSAIEVCTTEMGRRGLQATLATGDMRATAFDDGMFDAVVDVFSSYCLDEKQFPEFLREVSRVLKPGGLFFCYTPSKGSDLYLREFMQLREGHAERFIDISTLNGIVEKSDPYYGNFYPFRFIAKRELSGALNFAGMRAEYLETVRRTYGGGRQTFEFVVCEAVKFKE